MWRVKNALTLNRLTRKEKIWAKIRGFEQIGDIRPDNIMREIYDFLAVPKGRVRRFLWGLIWEPVAFGIVPPEVKVNPWEVMGDVDREKLRELAEKAPGKHVRTIKRRVEAYDRGKRGGIYETGALINVLESRIAITKALLAAYWRRISDKNTTEQ